MGHTVKAAVVQASPVVMDCGATVDKFVSIVGDLGRQGVQVALFPEVFIPACPGGRKRDIRAFYFV